MGRVVWMDEPLEESRASEQASLSMLRCAAQRDGIEHLAVSLAGQLIKTADALADWHATVRCDSESGS